MEERNYLTVINSARAFVRASEHYYDSLESFMGSDVSFEVINSIYNGITKSLQEVAGNDEALYEKLKSDVFEHL